MARESTKTYQRGFAAGREQVALALSILIDAWPRTLSKATIAMIGDEPLITVLSGQLKRFVEDMPRRRRSSSADAGEQDEAVQ
jgi:hypothetical protein